MKYSVEKFQGTIKKICLEYQGMVVRNKINIFKKKAKSKRKI